MKIVYDIDDTLWGLNKRICEKLNIDENKIVRFVIEENLELTEEEQRAIVKEYTNSDNFIGIPWYSGIMDVLKVEEYGAKVYFKSNSTSEEIAFLKRQQLMALLDVKDEQLQLNIISIGECKRKPLDNDMDIFIDDSPYNIANSSAKINIVLNHPWNMGRDADEIMKGKNIIRFDTLNEINKFIYEYVVEKCC